MRALVRKLGHVGYRLHRHDLAGKPDLVWIGRKRAIFVHGCFWHGHGCSRGARKPATRAEYWEKKIRRNRERDVQHVNSLRAAGYDVLTVWECELKNPDTLLEKLESFLEATSSD